jgi:TolA-binding protein
VASFRLEKAKTNPEEVVNQLTKVVINQSSIIHSLKERINQLEDKVTQEQIKTNQIETDFLVLLDKLNKLK